MINEIKLLTKVQICNFFGINEAIHSKDGKKKNKMYTTLFAILILGVFLCIQVGGTTYLLISFESSHIIPSMIGTMISSISLMLTLFRAGPTLFSIKSFEKTVCLPVKTESIVISRYLNIYIYNLIFSLAIAISSIVVCGISGNPRIVFYPTMLFGAFLLPLLPITLSVIIGTIGYYFASRVQRKNLMSIIWQIGILAFVFFVSFSSTEMPDEEMVGKWTEQMTSTEKYYPILDWFSDGVNGNIIKYLLFTVISLAVTFGLLILISKFYKNICIGLSATSAKRNYKMTKQISRSLFKTLYIRELKRYFASATYVMNTIIGFILAAAFGILLPILGIESLCEEVGLPYQILTKILPILIGLICNMMPITAASISMEGKNFWLLQSLPISMKNIANAKVMLNMTFAAPACIFASTGLSIALKTTITDMIFIFVIPLILTAFGSVLGLYINIINPMMEWESETTAVKQSKSGIMSMFVILVSEIVTMIIYFITPDYIVSVVNIIIVAIFILITLFIYNRIIKTDIRTIK